MRLIWSEPGCQVAQISAKRWGDAAEVEVAAHVDGVCPLSNGVNREDRCE